MRPFRLLVAAVVLVAGVIGVAVPRAEAIQGLTVTPVMTGLSHAWDLAFAPDGTMFVTERPGRIAVRVSDGSTRHLRADMGDLWVSGETGLMGIEVDPDFANNRRIYTCQGTTDGDFTVQVVAWTVDAAYTSLARANDPLVGGIEGSSGRHGGCQLRIDPFGSLWVGTGDAATGTHAQSPTTLSGKVLRVDRFTGAGVPGNPFFAEGGNRARMFSWGHRNVQGLAVRPSTGQMWSVEHGPDRDDEINRLVPGGNYGWDPVPGYNESVPMTDLGKFPGAIPAAWSSGPTTFAVSGAAFLRGEGWGVQADVLAVSALKDRRLRFLIVDGNGSIVGTHIPPELDGRYGRLRGAEVGPGGVLFVTTDNGVNDQVLAVTPQGELWGGGTSAAPAPGLDVVTRGIDDAVWVRSWNGSAWSAPASLGGLATSDADVASWGGDRLDVVVRGTDGAVWHRARQGGAWSAWVSLGGTATSGPSIAASPDGTLRVFVRGVDGGLWSNVWSAGWSGWSSLGGGLLSDPDAAAIDGGRADVYVRGLDNNLWRRRLINGVWQGWEWRGGILTSGPAAAAGPGGRVDVFVRGVDGALWHTYDLGDSHHQGWDLGAGVLTSAPDATWRGGFLDAFVTGDDGALYQFTWLGSAWFGPGRLG